MTFRCGLPLDARQMPRRTNSRARTIRARVKSDLEALRKHCLPDLGEIEGNAGTDYRYRAKAPRENFKNEVAKKQGKHGATIYGKVWDVLYGLQTVTEQRRHPRPIAM